MDTRLDLHLTARRGSAAGAERARGGLVLGAAIVVLAGLIGLAVEGHGVSWLAGLIAGVGAGAGIALARSRDRTAVGAPLTARPERLTAAAVQPLEQAGWRFLHEVAGPDSTYDHIAVGHGGLILLESLNPHGVVTMRAGEPVVERREDPQAPPRVERLRPRVLADASVMREGVQRIAGRRMWVQAVVVFWSDFPAGCVADGRCVYIHGSRLADWMARRPNQLDEVEAQDIFAAVQVLADHAGDLSLPVAI